MIIRRIKKEDLETRVEWMNNPAIYSSMHYDIPIVLENTLSWFKKNLDNNNRADVVFEEDDKIVAMGGLTGIDSLTNKAELYIFVNPFQQSKGIGTKATKLLCKYGFDNLGLKKIYLVTDVSNVSAQKVYEKVGFKLEGKLRKEYLTKDGILEDILYFGLLKEEWNKND